MKLPCAPYLIQARTWPGSGQHILASFDDEIIVVYQAYRPSIGRFAAENGRFGGEFSFSRMSWIKPNFLWMMYRSGWGTKKDQETTLAVRLKRGFFEGILGDAVPSTFDPKRSPDRAAWQDAVKSSDVRLQWDPDHDPYGNKVERRAVQLGLRGDTLKRYAAVEPVDIMDITAFVAEQRAHLETDGLASLSTPEERVYRPARPELCDRLGFDAWPAQDNEGHTPR